VLLKFRAAFPDVRLELEALVEGRKPLISSHDAAKESNLPSRGLPGPASFEDWQARHVSPVFRGG
jgi:hypothetical protein